MNILASSENNFGTASLNAFEMSLMYVNRGPSTDPWGTPHFTICDYDVTPFTLINRLRSYKYVLNQLRGVP